MPKKTFSFDVTGRKLFAAERVAVDAFVRKYPAGGESSVLAQRAAKEQAGELGPGTGDAKTTAAPNWTNARKRGKQAPNKKPSSFAPISSDVIKGLIFGVPAVVKVKPAPATKRRTVATATTGSAAPSKRPPTKRSASRAVRP